MRGASEVKRRLVLISINRPRTAGRSHALWKTSVFRVTDDLDSDFFFAYSGKRWPGCCAAQFRTPRGPALIPRETVGRTSEGGRFTWLPWRAQGWRPLWE